MDGRLSIDRIVENEIESYENVTICVRSLRSCLPLLRISPVFSLAPGSKVLTIESVRRYARTIYGVLDVFGCKIINNPYAGRPETPRVLRRPSTSVRFPWIRPHDRHVPNVYEGTSNVSGSRAHGISDPRRF